MREKAELFVSDHSYRQQVYAIKSKLSSAYTNPWFSSPSNYLSPRQEHFGKLPVLPWLSQVIPGY